MNKENSFDIEREIINKYNREEFETILSYLPRYKLIMPLKKYPKQFKKEIAGFRPDNLSDKKVFGIYYNRIFKQKDENLGNHIYNHIDMILEEVENQIKEKIEDSKNIRKKIEKNDMICFVKLIDILIQTKISKNISLYFKMVDYELTDEQSDYCNNEVTEKIMGLEIERKIKKTVEIKYEELFKVKKFESEKLILKKDKEIRALKNETNKQLKNKDDQIEELNSKMKKDLGDKDKQIKELNKMILNYEKKIIKTTLNDEKTVEKLNFEIMNMKDLIEKVKKDTIEKSNLLNLKQVEFNKYAIEKWNNENLKLKKIKEVLEQKNIDLQNNKNKKMKKIENMKLENKKLLDAKIVIEDQTKNVIENIKEVYNLLGNTAQTTLKETLLFIEQGTTIKSNIEYTDNKIDYIEDLKINIEITGIKKEYSYEMARYIYVTFANEMGLVLVGSEARLIADAISKTTCSRSIDIISIPPGFCDCNDLIENVKLLKSEVILIENGIDSMYESVYFPLLKTNMNKHYIFSVENREMFNLIPKSILNYLVVLDMDSIMTFAKDEELLHGKTNKEIFKNNNNDELNQRNYKKIHTLDKIIKLPNSVKLKLAKLMTDINQVEEGDSMYSVLLLYFDLFADKYDKYDEFIEIIEEQNFNPAILKLLQEGIGVNINE